MAGASIARKAMARRASSTVAQRTRESRGVMRVDGCAAGGCQYRRGRPMIGVTVGDEDRLDARVALASRFQDRVDGATGGQDRCRARGRPSSIR